jgi:hypothetical protein
MGVPRARHLRLSCLRRFRSRRDRGRLRRRPSGTCSGRHASVWPSARETPARQRRAGVSVEPSFSSSTQCAAVARAAAHVALPSMRAITHVVGKAIGSSRRRTPAAGREQARAGPALGALASGQCERRDATPSPRPLHGLRSGPAPCFWRISGVRRGVPQVLLRCWHGYVAPERTLPHAARPSPLVVAVALHPVVRLIALERGW